jgi:LmbE family N-acetylglucosaminyl deacetylase
MNPLLTHLKRRLSGGSSPLLKLALALRDPMQHPRLMALDRTRRVVVLAPHMDDEAIGCGGAILQHVASGARVVVAFLTDGQAGDRRLYDPTLPDGERQAIRRWLYDTRRDEAQRWCAGAGVAAHHFFDAPDGRLGDEKILTQTEPLLRGLLRRERPEVIYLPSLLDTHKDHAASNMLLMRSLAATGPAPVWVRGFEVWSPTAANAVLDITSSWPRKRDLLLGYRSQLTDVDYVRAIEGLNAYRAMLLPTGNGHAEAFLQLTPTEHAKCMAAFA